MVVAASLGLVGLGSPGSANAQALPLAPEVTLTSAPTAGAAVRGRQVIEGAADAPEGIARVDLYVLPHQPGSSVVGQTAVAGTTSSAPLGRVEFAFTWDTTTTVQGAVDVIVVATSRTRRTAEARVVSLRVSNSARPPAAPVATPAPVRGRPVTAPAPARVQRPVAGPVVAPVHTTRVSNVRAQRLPAPMVADATQEQAEAFYSVLRAPVAADAATTRRVSASVARDAGRGAAPSVALALILLLAAAHTQRAVRVTLAPAG